MNLKSGYTTGTHTTGAFKSALIKYLSNRDEKIIDITLPNLEIANIKIEEILRDKTLILSKSIKSDNDDLDVTKGCEIIIYLSNKLNENLLSTISQTPQILNLKNSKLYIYAGSGVGVVIKEGLKIKPNYPAINPIPLKMLKSVADKFEINENLYLIVSVKDGEIIAKETANAKVGVIGGISILGTSGIVKPISNIAYLDSIKVEISVAKSECYRVVFTLGNSAFKFAKENYSTTCIIEIGNFIYDSFNLLKDSNFREVIFIVSIGKMTKVAQGLKNTHNRFGEIDFNLVKLWVKEEFDINFNIEFNTTKMLIEELEKIDKNLKDKFYKLITKKTNIVLNNWYENLKNIKIISLELTRNMIK